MSSTPVPSAQNSGMIAQQLLTLGIALPPSAAPVANYVPYVITGNLVIISGQLPFQDGALQYLGKVGQDVTIEQAQHAAKLCGIGLLAHLQAACGGNLEKVKRCVRLGVFVQSALGFSDQPKVANGVSDLMVSVFGDAGKHARAAVGVNELPFGVSVEVEGTFEIA